MIFRTDTPKGSPIVVYMTGSKWPEILFLGREPYEHYYDYEGEEIPIGMIQKWASLEEEPSLHSNLDEAAEDSWTEYEYRESPKGLYSTCYVDGFKAGAEWMAGRGWISVDERLPEMDEEVIVLSDELGTAPIYKIAFGHIVDVRCIDYNGWNIPGVKYWMPCPEIPNSD